MSESPLIAAAATANPDINYVLVHGQGSHEDFFEFIDRAGLYQPNVLHIDDTSGALWRRFGVRQQPTSLLIQRDGTVTSSLGSFGADRLEFTAHFLRNEEPPV